VAKGALRALGTKRPVATATSSILAATFGATLEGGLEEEAARFTIAASCPAILGVALTDFFTSRDAEIPSTAQYRRRRRPPLLCRSAEVDGRVEDLVPLQVLATLKQGTGATAGGSLLLTHGIFHS